MADAPVAAKAPETHNQAHNDATDHQQHPGGMMGWVADAASSAWSSTAGAMRVAGHFTAGVVKEVVEHPGKTAAEVGLGVAAVAGAAELGIGAGAMAAAAAIPLAAYGAYEGIKIASKEGVGAIPGHMAHAWEDAKHSASELAAAAGTVYSGKGGEAAVKAAEDKIEDAGRAATPFAAAAVGGAGSEIARGALSAGMRGLEGILPPMAFTEPAFAYAGAGGVVGGARAAAIAGGRLSGEGAASAAAGMGGAIHMSESSDGGAGGGGKGDGARGDGGASGDKSGLSDYDRQQHFIEGTRPVTHLDGNDGMITVVGRGFGHIDEVLARGGRVGNIQFEDMGKGMYSATVTEGPLAGRVALWEKGTPVGGMEGGLPGQTHNVPVLK